MDNILFLLLVISVVAVLFMYKTLNEYRLNYLKISNENNYLKARIDDLKSYKNDVSKTFEILNNDLKIINEELKKTEPASTELQTNETLSSAIQDTVDISTINPIEVFSQYFFRPDNVNGTNGNFRSNFGIHNRNSSGNSVQNSNPLENYTDQLLDTISRHLVNLS